MSNSPIRRDDPAPSPSLARISRLAGTARNHVPHLVNVVTTPARALAFWTAIALPVLNLALLVQGLSTPSETFTFLALLAVNVFALVVGHPHRRD